MNRKKTEIATSTVATVYSLSSLLPGNRARLPLMVAAYPANWSGHRSYEPIVHSRSILWTQFDWPYFSHRQNMEILFYVTWPHYRVPNNNIRCHCGLLMWCFSHPSAQSFHSRS